MVMPNIGALIAWGVLTALFIPDGYLPNEAFATMDRPNVDVFNSFIDRLHRREEVIGGDRGSVVRSNCDDGCDRWTRYSDDVRCHDHGSIRWLCHQEI